MAGNELEVVDGIECLSPRLVTLDLSSNFIVQLPACAFEPIQGQANFALTGYHSFSFAAYVAQYLCSQEA